MKKFLIDEAAFAGFRFVRAHPKIVAVWAGAFLAMALVSSAAFVLTAGPQMTALMALGPRPDPQEAMPIFAKLAPLYGLAMLLACVFYPTLYAAMSRALLRPEDDRFAYIRLGGAEFNQFVLFLVFMALGMVAYVGLILALVLLGIGAGLALGKLAGVLAAFAGFIAAACGFIFLSVRLSLASPMTFDKGRIDLFGSWALTRGRFWSLFGCYLLVAVLMTVFMLPILVIVVATAMAMGGGLGGLRALFRPDMSSIAVYFSPLRMVLFLLGAGIYAAFWPVVLMPPVNAYMQIAKRDEVTSP